MSDTLQLLGTPSSKGTKGEVVRGATVTKALLTLTHRCSPLFHRLAEAHSRTRFWRIQAEKGSADLQTARRQLLGSPYNSDPRSPRTPRSLRQNEVQEHMSSWEEAAFARTVPVTNSLRAATEEDLNRNIRTITSSMKIELRRKGANDVATKCSVFYAQRIVCEVKKYYALRRPYESHAPTAAATESAAADISSRLSTAAARAADRVSLMHSRAGSRL